MFDKLRMRNFQAYADSELVFSSGVNIITGTSNCGKTSIVRALDLIINNKPLGDGYINDDSNETTVDLCFTRKENKCCVTRERDRKTKNIYKLNCGGDTEILNAGTSPPVEISNILNISDINIQQQLSPYFLVLDSPGKIALYIRKIAKLDEIDDVISIISSDERDCSKETNRLQTEFEENNIKLAKINLIDVKKLKIKINEATVLSENVEKLLLQRSELDTIIKQLKQISSDMIYLPEDLEEKLDIADISIDIYSNKARKLRLLQDTVESLQNIYATKINLPNDIKDKISVTETIFCKYNNNIQQLDCLENILSDLMEYDADIDELKKNEVLLLQNEQEILQKLDMCPSCGVLLTELSKKTLIEKW